MANKTYNNFTELLTSLLSGDYLPMWKVSLGAVRKITWANVQASDWNEQTPGLPAADKWKIYFKSDGLYVKDDAGAETGPMGAGGGSVVLSAASPRVYTANDTWNKPAGLHHVIVEMTGGGGGGGGVNGVVSQAACAGAGGGGEYAKGKILAASLGATETVTIGAGGNGGAAGNNNGTDGGTTSFGAHITTLGGKGGTGQDASATVPRTSAPAGVGGTGGAGGQIRVAGDSGFPGLNVQTNITQASLGGGNPIAGRVKDALTDNTLDTNGANGLQYGGGGSGARASNTDTDYAGGNGASGVVIVWEYIAA